MTSPTKAIFDSLSAHEHELYRVTNWAPNSETGEVGTVEPVDCYGKADIIASSIPGTGLHTIMLDLDVPAKLVPSSTPGHSHLYIDVTLPWWRYRRLLDALVEANVLEPGYVRASKVRGFTALRLPWIRKDARERAA